MGNWIPGAQQWPYWPRSRRLPRALSRSFLVFGARDAARHRGLRGVLNKDTADIDSVQLTIRARISSDKKPGLPPRDTGVVRLGGVESVG